MLKPLGSHVLLKPISGVLKRGGIVIPDSVRDNQRMALVVAVGPGEVSDGKFVETTIKVGDVVLMPNYAARELISDDGEKYVLTKESEIEAKA